MKNNFPLIVIPPEVRRKMTEIAREFRKEPTRGEKILWEAVRGKKLDGIKFRRPETNLLLALDMIHAQIQALKLNQQVPSPHVGEGEGGG